MNPSSAELHDAFAYHQGRLYWRHSPRASVPSGAEAGSVSARGYRVIWLRRHSLLAHRIVFAMVHNEWPAAVDHINGDKLDNRVENLRACTPQQNQANRAKTRANKSGFKGVSAYRGRWVATISANGRLFYLGAFDDPAAAHAAYCREAARLHGEFARTE